MGDASSSNATISVSGSGAFSGDDGNVLIGAADGAAAIMLVSGAASAVELNGLAEIGDYGSGSLLIEKGGYASLGGGTAVFVCSTDDGSSVSGNVSVTGVGSLLSINGSLIVGTAEIRVV